MLKKLPMSKDLEPGPWNHKGPGIRAVLGLRREKVGRGRREGDRHLRAFRTSSCRKYEEGTLKRKAVTPPTTSGAENVQMIMKLTLSCMRVKRSWQTQPCLLVAKVFGAASTFAAWVSGPHKLPLNSPTWVFQSQNPPMSSPMALCWESGR